MATISCPFVYANGNECTGRIIGVEAYKADIEWRERDEGQWSFAWQARSHYHLFCSERGNHAGYKRTDDDRMKFSESRLPDEVRALIERTRSVTAER